MSPESKLVAAILFLSVPTIAAGGAALLHFVSRRVPGYLDNPVRQALFRAGHAHAGVLVILSLVALLYVDGTALSPGAKALARWSIAAAPILMPLGFFLSVASPRAERPNGLLALVYVGAASLMTGTIVLGLGIVLAL